MKRMAKKVKPGKLRGNTTPNLLTENPNDYTRQLEVGKCYIVKISTQATGTSGKPLKEPRIILSDVRPTCV